MNERNYEDLVISLLLRNPAEAPMLRLTLSDEHFISIANREAYLRSIEYIEGAGVAPTPDILKEILSQKHPKDAKHYEAIVDRLFSVVHEADAIQHLPYYCQALEDRYLSNTAKNAMLSATDSLEAGNVRDAIETLQKEVKSPSSDFVVGDMAKDFMAFYQDYEQLEKNPGLRAGVKLGFPSIDSKTGGHGRRELWVITGGTGVGKSLSLGQIAINAALAGKKTLLVTIENDRESYMRRLYSNLARVPYHSLKTGYLKADEKTRLMTAIGSISSKFYLKVVEFPEGCSAREISSFMRGLPEMIDYVVVDQITNMRPNNPKEFKTMDWRWYSQIALELRRLAASSYNNYGVPVLTAIHAAGGTGDKKELTTDDTAVAKSVQWHAHANLFITRQESEYNMGASKMRDAKIETFAVHPTFEFWSLTEEVGYDNVGENINPNIKTSASQEVDDFEFDPEKLDREIAESNQKAEDLIRSLVSIPESQYMAEESDVTTVEKKPEAPLVDGESL